MTKIQVSERAVLQRLNRALKASGRTIKRCKITAHDYPELGDFYEVDATGVTAKHVNLVQAAARVLQPHESLDLVAGRHALGMSEEEWATDIATSRGRKMASAMCRLMATFAMAERFWNKHPEFRPTDMPARGA